jgi:hypothetical protein
MECLKESDMKIFAFTTKHHEGLSTFDTKTRVKSSANRTASGGSTIRVCDIAQLAGSDRATFEISMADAGLQGDSSRFQHDLALEIRPGPADDHHIARESPAS